METMKRAISFFMALVLVLGMVPGAALSAAAEEVEALPEAVETTEAPAETEAEETAEAPAETEAEETAEAPAETEAEETEAPAETLPAETVEETEVYEEDLVVLPAANAAAAPTGITVKASTKRTYVGGKVKLSATVKPADADQDAYKWQIIDDQDIGAAFNEDTGVLTAQRPGTVQVRAVSTVDKGVKKTVEITFVDVRIAFNLAPIDEDYLEDTDGDKEMDAVRLSPGQKVEVSLKYQTNETGDEDDWVTEYLLEPDVTWKRSSASEAYASLTVDDEDESVVTLKAKTVTETKHFTLTATDAIAGKAVLDVYICPDPAGLEIFRATGTNVTGKTITIDLGKYDREKYSFHLFANVVPGDAVQKIKWTSSSEMVAGVEVVEDSNGTEVIVTVGGERLEGEATLTAICKEDTTIRQTVRIKTVDYLQKDELCWHSDTKKVTDLVAGESVLLKALDKTDPDNKKRLTSEKVVWSVRNEDKAYATISENGTLKARDVAMGKEIMVYCRVIGNEDEAFLRLPVLIRPKAQYVTIEGGSTKYVNTLNLASESISVGHMVAPVDDGEDMGASQKVTWKSSDTTIAKVGKDSGKIYWQGKNGTVTITATAADGSGKSDSITVKFGKFAEEITIACPVSYLRSGEYVVMSKSVQPAGASTKVTWSLADGDEKYASITSGGKLTIKPVYEIREITVIAVAEGSGVKDKVNVQIRPAKGRILTLFSGDECVTNTTQQLDKATESIELTARIVGLDGTEDVKWSYPTSLVKKVYDDGNGNAVFEMRDTGTAVIKATSRASGKTASVTVKGIRKAERVRIVESGDMELSAGQSMTLKAKLYDAEGKTPTRTDVRWSVFANSHVSINDEGKLTVKSTYKGDPQIITVTARATDGSGVKDTAYVTVRPAATGVMIQRAGVTRVSLAHKIEEPGDEKFRLTALVYPLGCASEAVTWSSSDEEIATVSANGGVTCKGTGTVTIKATAKDGSGKYATMKLTITKPVYSISFTGNRSMIAGGRSLTLEPVVKAADGKKPTSSALTWSLSGDISYVESFEKGVMKTKVVSERKYVTVKVTAKDGSGVSKSFKVTICPATTSVQILDEFDNKVGDKTLYMRAGETMDLGAISYPNGSGSMAAQAWNWTSSSKTYATVNSAGVVTAKKAGTVTIKAEVKDGTAKYDTVTIKILSK